MCVNLYMTVYANISLHVTIQQVRELRQDLTKLYLTSGTSRRRSSRQSGRRGRSDEQSHSDVEVRCLHHTH